MNKSAIFKKAHELTKQLLQDGDNYQVTFGACLAWVYEVIDTVKKEKAVFSFDDRRKEGWSFLNNANTKQKNVLVVRNDSLALVAARSHKEIAIEFKRGISDLKSIKIVEEMTDYLFAPKNCTVFKIEKIYA